MKTFYFDFGPYARPRFIHNRAKFLDHRAAGLAYTIFCTTENPGEFQWIKNRHKKIESVILTKQEIRDRFLQFIESDQIESFKF